MTNRFTANPSSLSLGMGTVVGGDDHPNKQLIVVGPPYQSDSPKFCYRYHPRESEGDKTLRGFAGGLAKRTGLDPFKICRLSELQSHVGITVLRRADYAHRTKMPVFSSLGVRRQNQPT